MNRTKVVKLSIEPFSSEWGLILLQEYCIYSINIYELMQGTFDFQTNLSTHISVGIYMDVIIKKLFRRYNLHS